MMTQNRRDSSTNLPRTSVSLLGQLGAGKTTLAAAILAVMSERGGAEPTTYRELIKQQRAPSYGPELFKSSSSFTTEKRSYSLQDYDRDMDVRASFFLGGPRQGILLVVDAADLAITESRAQLAISRRIDRCPVVVFVNKADLVAAEQVDAAIDEVRRMLSSYGYVAADVPVIAGSASQALTETSDSAASAPSGIPSIERLVDAMDAHFPSEPVLDEGPFLLPIESTSRKSAKTVWLCGRIERGTVRPGDGLELVGCRSNPIPVIAGEMGMMKKPMEIARANENVGISISGLSSMLLGKGQVLAAPGSMQAWSDFDAVVYLYILRGRKPTNWTRKRSLFDRSQPSIWLRATPVGGELTLPGDVDAAGPGEIVTVSGRFKQPMPIERGTRFGVTVGGHIVGAGIVTSC